MRQELSKLAELEEAGVRVIGEVPLRQQPQTQELIVMLLQMGKIGGGRERRAIGISTSPYKQKAAAPGKRDRGLT